MTTLDLIYINITIRGFREGVGADGKVRLFVHFLIPQIFFLDPRPPLNQ